MSRRRPLTGVEQAGMQISLTLLALANVGKKVTVDSDGVPAEGQIVDQSVSGGRHSSWRVRYRVRIRRVGLAWMGADNISFG